AAQAPVGGGEGVLEIAVLVLEQVAQIIVGEKPEQTPAPPETGRKLEIGEISAAVAAPQPVLLLGEVVVANPRPVQLAKRGPGGTEIGAVAVGPGNLEGDPVDPAAHEDRPS